MTFNLKDFPDEAGAPYRVSTWHSDNFLVHPLSEHTDTVLAIIAQQTAAFRNPSVTVAQFLTTLTVTVPLLANLAADPSCEPSGPLPTRPNWVVTERRADE